MLTAIRHASRRNGLLDRNLPKPPWLGLDPGEAYFGSYQRYGITWVGLAGLAASLALAVLSLYGGNAAWSSVAITAPLFGLLATTAARKLNRVHVTSKALIYRQLQGFHIIKLASIDGVSYGGQLPRWQVQVHITESGQRTTLILKTAYPRQTAEELSQLIAQYSGEEIAATGGK